MPLERAWCSLYLQPSAHHACKSARALILLLLQMVPSKDELLSNVHITPVRASRALSLRYLASRFGLDMDGVAVSFAGGRVAVRMECCLKVWTTFAPGTVVLNVLLLAIADHCHCQVLLTACIAPQLLLKSRFCLHTPRDCLTELEVASGT